VLTEEYKILNCHSEIVSLAWKPRQSGQDRNKFVIYTSEGEICEHTFYERNYHVLDLSCKGEICISVQNPASQQSDNENEKRYNLQTINLNENKINFERINYQQLILGAK